MANKGFDPYFIGDVIHWQDPVAGITVPGSQPLDWNFLQTHVEAISGYNLYDPTKDPATFLADIRVHWAKYRSQADVFGLRFVPFILPGYDDRKLRGSHRPILGRASGTFYKQNWDVALDFMDATVPHVALTSFNEWHEGTEIEPSVQYGLSYLELTSRLVNDQQSAWGTPRDLRDIIGAVNPSKTLNMNTDVEVDEFLSILVARAQSHVTSYLNRNFENEPLPEAIKEITLWLASNLYNHALKVRQGPLVQAGEFEVQLMDDAVFTESLRRDLAPFRKQRLKVLFP